MVNFGKRNLRRARNLGLYALAFRTRRLRSLHCSQQSSLPLRSIIGGRTIARPPYTRSFTGRYVKMYFYRCVPMKGSGNFWLISWSAGPLPKPFSVSITFRNYHAAFRKTSSGLCRLVFSQYRLSSKPREPQASPSPMNYGTTPQIPFGYWRTLPTCCSSFASLRIPVQVVTRNPKLPIGFCAKHSFDKPCQPISKPSYSSASPAGHL